MEVCRRYGAEAARGQRMTFRVALESLKLDYSLRPEHKTFQLLLREAAIGLVLEEEGVASLMEVPDHSGSDRGQEVRSSKGNTPR
jgi:hypothetical protein